MGDWICVCIKIRVDLLSTRGIGFTLSGFGGSVLAPRMVGVGLGSRGIICVEVGVDLH